MKARKTIISNVDDTGVKVDEIKIDTNFDWTTLPQSDPNKIIAGFFDISNSSYAREEKLDKIVAIDDYNSINKKLSGCTRL